MEEVAYAKINLALHVRAREPDGYHSLETLFAFAEEGDLLRSAAAGSLSLKVTGPFAAQLGETENNLVLQAAQALRSRYGVSKGAALTLDKRLPVASGIGGGSADAAAALRLLVRWWGLPFQEDALLDIAGSLGADVAACLRSELARGTGRGDRLEALKDRGLSGTPLLLVNPGVPLSTASVFGRWDGVDRGALEDDPARSRNDLETAACMAAPVVRDVLDLLGSLDGTVLTRMSGSGATCFALFQSEQQRDEGAARIAASRAQWWTLASRLR
ncbi:MAG TPA: 4-(cytidine 5'-diphospho)-2-C-methyl-D-erythritol kinase [Allosphingosinicella sp.]